MTRVIALLTALALLSAVAQAGSPDDARQRQAKAHFRQGAAYYGVGSYEQALKEYLAAYELLPLPDILFNIGQALRMTGHKQRAIDYYRRYLEVRTSGQPSDEARDYVASLTRDLEEEVRKRHEVEAQEEAEAEARARRQTEANAKADAERRADAEAQAKAEANRPPPLAQRWQFWVGIGFAAAAVIAGVTVGAVIGTRTWTNLPDVGPGSRAGLTVRF